MTRQATDAVSANLDEPLPAGPVDWRAEYACTAGVQAFIYGFPRIYNAQLRHDWVTNRRDPDVVPYAAVNHFWHAARLLDAGYRDGGCPSTDTPYTIAWLDLREEPVPLSHPDMGERVRPALSHLAPLGTPRADGRIATVPRPARERLGRRRSRVGGCSWSGTATGPARCPRASSGSGGGLGNNGNARKELKSWKV